MVTVHTKIVISRSYPIIFYDTISCFFYLIMINIPPSFHPSFLSSLYFLILHSFIHSFIRPSIFSFSNLVLHYGSIPSIVIGHQLMVSPDLPSWWVATETKMIDSHQHTHVSIISSYLPILLLTSWDPNYIMRWHRVKGLDFDKSVEIVASSFHLFYRILQHYQSFDYT